jgi:hypothetical protein
MQDYRGTTLSLCQTRAKSKSLLFCFSSIQIIITKRYHLHLIKQELQTSNYSKAEQFHYKPSFMSLSYIRADGHKQAVTHI